MKSHFRMKDGKMRIEVPVSNSIIQIPEVLQRGRNYIARMEPVVVQYGKHGAEFIINWRIMSKGQKVDKNKLKSVK